MKQLILIFSFLLIHVNSFAVIRYVREGGTGLQTGDSWANASGDLQLMINQSSSLALDTIYVAEGTYIPIRPADNLNTIDAANRNNAFTFTSNIQVFGGFPASGNPALSERNPVTYITTLSGNIGDPGVSTDNAYHVVITAGAAVTRDFVLDGFHVTGGLANVANSITVNGVLIQERCGAGWNNNGGSPTIRNSVFTGNVIGNDGSGFGVAFYNNGNPEFLNVAFINNNGPLSRGGAFYNWAGNSVLTNVTMQGNYCNVGGAWYHRNGSAELNNVTIAGNGAYLGAAVSLSRPVTLTFNNCIIANNASGSGPAIEYSVLNSWEPPTFIVNYSLIEGFAGGGNQNLDGTVDPQFESPVAGSLAPTAAGNYRLKATSPCINTGSNALLPAGVLTDLDGQERVIEATVDMGAYEYDVPLPVTLISFNVTKEGQTALLKWSTSAETNSDRFEIERSLNGKTWNKIGMVDSYGESTVLRDYQYVDYTPASGVPSHGGPSHGENLYRLKMVDKDATFAYSRIQSIKFDGNAPDLSIYPNPSTDKLNIRDYTNVKEMVISDLNGRLVYQSASFSQENGTVDIKNLAEGMYIVKLTRLNGKISTHKIVINK
jgi:hypothetical protein